MYERITLPNGARILFQKIYGLRSASLGIWIASGSRDEAASENGSAHFIEHMVFKGTPEYSAARLAREMDLLGGRINAFTTKECTCFYAHVLDCHLEKAWELLTSMVFNANFSQDDVETERSVILEEIGMYRDEPDDLVSEQLMKKIYRGNALARPILGTPTTLNRLTGEKLKAWHDLHYGSDRIVVSLAGSFDDSIISSICQRLECLTPCSARAASPACYQPAIVLKKKATEQNHLMLAFPSLPTEHPDRYGMQLLSTALGDGMSSRLFQRVREELGLCYTVSSYSISYQETGLFCIYTATGQDTEAQALDTICQIIQKTTESGLTREELDLAREQAKANVLMGLESTSARMSYLARCELDDHGYIRSADDLIDTYDAVTLEQVRHLATSTFDFSRASLSAVGKIRAEEQYLKLLGSLQ